MIYSVKTSQLRGASRFAALLGTASLFTIASVSAAQAAAAAPAGAAAGEVVSEVTITGSLIAGAAAVGVPVTTLGAEDFLVSGSLTASEMLRNVPAMDVDATTSSLGGGGTTGFGQNVAIHGLQGSGGDATTLMLVNDKRWPVQGHGGDTVDPSLIPAIAVDRIDILTSGSSERYGSDAVTGVLNVVMITGFDGAKTQVSLSGSPEVGRPAYVLSQLWGRSWDGGNVTVALENYDQRALRAVKRDYYTSNYIPWGFFDNTPLAASIPAVVSIGSPSRPSGTPARFSANTGTHFCSDCYALPHGVGWNYGDTDAHTDPQNPVPTTAWSTILGNQFIVRQANEQNQVDPYRFTDALPHQHRWALWASADYDLTDDLWGLGPISAYLNGFYNNRRAVTHVPANIGGSGNSAEHLSLALANGMPVPTVGDECTDFNGDPLLDDYGDPVSGALCTSTPNPYYPEGAPQGINVHYLFSADLGNNTSRINAAIIEARYEFGFHLNALPFDWVGDAYYSMSQEQNNTHSTNIISQTHAMAALGWTIPEGDNPGEKQYAKPSDVPYLNVFCDSLTYKCNSPATIKYISGGRNQDNRWKIREIGANFSGPVYELPGGMLQGGLGVNFLSHHYFFTDWNDSRVHSKAAPSYQADYATQQSQSYFGQLNIPLLGPGFNAPLFEAVNIELGYRFDKFNFKKEWVKTPKIAADWTVGWGLTLRGAWGESYRTPSFGQRSAASGSRALPGNILGGGGGDEFLFDCDNQFPGGPAAGTAVPGSPTAILNPTCLLGAGNEEFEAPAGIVVNGGSGLGDQTRGIPLRPNVPKGLNPETSNQYTIGFNFTPDEGILSGLMIDVSYYNIKILDSIRSANPGDGDPNNPLSLTGFIIRPDLTNDTFHPNNAEFLKVIRDLQATGSATFNPIFIPDIKWIWDGANTNQGFVQYSGIDFITRYDWDMGSWGAWHIGASGYYEMDSKAKAGDLDPVISDYKGQNSGGRLQRVRYRLGWTDGVWGATLFANYKAHTPASNNVRLPDCFWREGFGPGDCYPGSPYYPQPFDQFYNGAPANVEWDLNLSYNSGMMPTNEYLRNINVNLSIQNILDHKPAFQLTARSRAREMRAYDRRWSELQRTLVLTVTKEW